jgi:glycosyltransferase involved in cell wall biosynthesis
MQEKDLVMKKFKTAAYTILKNEKKFIEKWMYYAQPYDYRVLLDTGSTDGSWELLQEYAKKDPNLIIEQKIFTTNFDQVIVDLKEKKSQWFNLEFFDQSMWKTKYFGIEPERFKMVGWQ